MSDLRAEAIQFIRAGLRVAAELVKTNKCEEPTLLPPFRTVTVQVREDLLESIAFPNDDPRYDVLVNFSNVIDHEVLLEVDGSLYWTGLEIGENDELYITFDLDKADRVLEGHPHREDALYDPFADTEEVNA